MKGNRLAEQASLSWTARYILMLIAAIGANLHVPLAADACELCRILGSNADHAPAVGGDDREDAYIAPPAPIQNGEQATAQFALSGGQWPQPGGRGSPVTLTYSYENLLDGGLKMPSGQPLPAGLIRRSVEEAFGLWAGVAPLHFVEVPDNGRPYGDPQSQFGQIRLRHLYINGPDIPGQQPIAKAQAYYPFGTGNLAGDVEFDNSDPWQQVGALSTPDVLGAAIHELGHSLGLAHSDLPQANMYWIFTRHGGPGTGALHSDDITGIRAIYGSGVGSVTPLAVPEPAAAVLIMFTCLLFIVTRRR